VGKRGAAGVVVVVVVGVGGQSYEVGQLVAVALLVGLAIVASLGLVGVPLISMGGGAGDQLDGILLPWYWILRLPDGGTGSVVIVVVTLALLMGVAAMSNYWCGAVVAVGDAGAAVVEALSWWSWGVFLGLLLLLLVLWLSMVVDCGMLMSSWLLLLIEVRFGVDDRRVR